MGMPFFESFRAEKLTVKRGEKPGFQLLWVTELVAFSGPLVKSLLGQITGVGLVMSQRDGEAIQHRVVLIDDLFEIKLYHFINSVIFRSIAGLSR